MGSGFLFWVPSNYIYYTPSKFTLGSSDLSFSHHNNNNNNNNVLKPLKCHVDGVLFFSHIEIGVSCKRS